jgi:hypothetical protein
MRRARRSMPSKDAAPESEPASLEVEPGRGDEGMRTGHAEGPSFSGGVQWAARAHSPQVFSS